jgi:5-formyltetrahydrofolate cyclo-ligase
LFVEGYRVDDKKALRARLRTARREHSAAIPASMRGLLFRHPPAPLLELVPAGATISVYHALPEEAPAGAYATWFAERGHKVALPWFASRGAPMEFHHWGNPFDDGELVADPYGALQPPADADELVPDVVFAPLVGFTADCQRLGQGGGYYDRWLAAHPSTTVIGLAWDCQLCEALPLEPHDRPLAAVVTPTRFYRASA